MGDLIISKEVILAFLWASKIENKIIIFAK